MNCFRLSLTSESPVIDDCWPERWANRIPRKPQASRKKTTRKSERRELRAILRFPSLRASFHPSYGAEYKQYITTLDCPESEKSPPVTARRLSSHKMQIRALEIDVSQQCSNSRAAFKNSGQRGEIYLFFAFLAPLGKLCGSRLRRQPDHLGGSGSILSRRRTLSSITLPTICKLLGLSLSTVSWVVCQKTSLYP